MKRVLYKNNVKNWRITVEDCSMRVEAVISIILFIRGHECVMICDDICRQIAEHL